MITVSQRWETLAWQGCCRC
uniref:Uncharacterized protein n=1 Tax=Rhizophora mucronata TaxID=61149 RepID=A0A2P2NDJ0_RHIMU